MGRVSQWNKISGLHFPMKFNGEVNCIRKFLLQSPCPQNKYQILMSGCQGIMTLSFILKDKQFVDPHSLENTVSLLVISLYFPNRRRSEKNHRFAMMAPLYCSRMSGPHCNCIDIPTVNIRGSSFHNIIMSFYDS